MLTAKDKKDIWDLVFLIALLSVWYLLEWYREKSALKKEKRHGAHR